MFENPLMSSKCSLENEPAPPKMASYGKLQRNYEKN